MAWKLVYELNFKLVFSIFENHITPAIAYMFYDWYAMVAYQVMISHVIQWPAWFAFWQDTVEPKWGNQTNLIWSTEEYQKDTNTWCMIRYLLCPNAWFYETCLQAIKVVVFSVAKYMICFIEYNFQDSLQACLVEGIDNIRSVTWYHSKQYKIRSV